MLPTSGSAAQMKISQDEKFYSRLLSKENTAANPSFRVYYGVAAAGAVPFLWESQPGTPKHPMNGTASLPPLTPPPSYYPISSKKKAASTRSPKRNLFHTLLPRLALRKAPHAPSPPPSISSSSTTSLSSGSHRRGRSSSPMSSFSSNSKGDDEEQNDGLPSPTSTLCFRERGGGCYFMGEIKNALLSIVGHGSGHGSASV